jgi:HK97 family phage portal protein
VLHVRLPLSVDGILGLSPIAATRHALPLADSLATMARSFAENGARPSGMLKASGHLAHGQAEMLRDLFDNRHGGARQAGGVLVVEGELDWTPLALALEDAQFIEQRRLSTAEIARIFRVPPWMIGAPSGDSMTYSNVHEQAAAFVKFSLTPYLTAIEQAISADADLAPGALYAEFVLDGLLRADAKTRAEVYRLALDPQTGWMSRPEVRELENLPPEPPRPGGVA